MSVITQNRRKPLLRAFPNHIMWIMGVFIIVSTVNAADPCSFITVQKEHTHLASLGTAFDSIAVLSPSCYWFHKVDGTTYRSYNGAVVGSLYSPRSRVAKHPTKAEVYRGVQGTIRRYVNCSGAYDTPFSGVATESPVDFAFDGQGNTYVYDEGRNQVLKCTSSYVCSVLSGEYHAYGAGQLGYAAGSATTTKIGKLNGFWYNPDTKTINVYSTGFALLIDTTTGASITSNKYTRTRGVLLAGTRAILRNADGMWVYKYIDSVYTSKALNSGDKSANYIPAGTISGCSWKLPDVTASGAPETAIDRWNSTHLVTMVQNNVFTIGHNPNFVDEINAYFSTGDGGGGTTSAATRVTPFPVMSWIRQWFH